ncbi:unnamed protein product [Brassicogethes aeneus]|uniref:Poly(A) RNA polymerase, mitochondrial n=1 Tax=Brassicogethes aeneus TaxID=1431903 RepID=A0A9P0AZ50_BRAAE|nr:unnamed protein product [Brassicogethes aeneus]
MSNIVTVVQMYHSCFGTSYKTIRLCPLRDMSIFLSFHNSRRKCMTLSRNIVQDLKLIYLKNSAYQKHRNYSQILQEKNSIEKVTKRLNSQKYVPFMQEINFRMDEANRSILVQVHSSQSYKELYSYCNTFGNVKKMMHYSCGVEPMHFIIVEFEEESNVKDILSASTHTEDSQVVPTYSQFLWFRASSRKLSKLKQSKTAVLTCEDATTIVKESEVKDMLLKCEDVSEQMITLYENTKLNDVGSRLRFLTAKQLESTVSGMFPNANAFPFGSSVNGCGKMGCDLDLVLRLDNVKENNKSRLIYHCKAYSGSERSTSQRHMETIGDIIHLFLPGCSQVRRILQAKVPIIKYHQHLTNVECDLSMTNMSGVYMSDFLYMMGSIDPRVRPLIFAVRKWASEVGLTNPSPGRWISNFSLTLLVLAFLQRPINSEPILPSLNTLTKFARPEDKYITEDGINCTFLRDLNLLSFKTKNQESLSDLLAEFFEFYSQFDFGSKAICLNEPVSLTKPEHSAMYIVNPLERGLNVSKNVSLEELEKFKVEIRSAAWALESQENKIGNWGLLSIFERRNNPSQFTLSSKHRMMEVSTLFNEENPIEFKNNNVKNQVESIKRHTHGKVKEVEKNIKRHTTQR